MSELLDMSTMTGDQVKGYIEGKLGQGRVIKVTAITLSNGFYMHTSKPFVFTQSLSQENLRNEDEQTGITDGDHILLFPQDNEGICPRSWIMAAYPYLEKFRSNFSFFPLEAEMYYNITLIGMPTGDRLGISKEVEEELKSADWRKVTRIECSNAEELEKALNKRIKANKAFLED